MFKTASSNHLFLPLFMQACSILAYSFLVCELGAYTRIVISGGEKVCEQSSDWSWWSNQIMTCCRSLLKHQPTYTYSCVLRRQVLGEFKHGRFHFSTHARSIASGRSLSHGHSNLQQAAYFPLLESLLVEILSLT